MRLRGQHLLSADLTLLKKMERESLLESLDWLVIHHFGGQGLALVVVVWWWWWWDCIPLIVLHCKISIPLGVSQVVSYYKEWRKSGGSNRILSSQLQFLESYKPVSKGKSCSIM